MSETIVQALGNHRDLSEIFTKKKVSMWGAAVGIIMNSHISITNLNIINSVSCD